MNSNRNAASIGRTLKRFFGFAFVVALTLALSGTVSAQKKKKKDESQPPAASSIPSLPDEQKIDYAIGEMLGAWQLGDIEKLHAHMADDVTVVAGTWTPPAMGWTNYLAAYQVQRARMQQVRMERSNTLIRVAPTKTVAWACYQWDFSAIVDGAPSAARGQTTLIFEKRGENWLIVHNHTSLVPASYETPPTTTVPQPTAPAPAKP